MKPTHSSPRKIVQAACDKYSAAIVVMKGVSDKKFASVLYGNRAACCLSMERCINVNTGAVALTELVVYALILRYCVFRTLVSGVILTVNAGNAIQAYRRVQAVALAKKRPKDPSFPIIPVLQLRAPENLPELTVNIKPLLEIAERIPSNSDKTLKALDERLGERADSGIISSFCAYPMAEAVAICAFCYRQLARLSTDIHETIDFLGKAHQSYQLAALAFPRDDEYHAPTLCSSLRKWVHPYASRYQPFHISACLFPIIVPSGSTRLWQRQVETPCSKRHLEFEAGAGEHIVQRNLGETEVFVDNFLSPEVHMGLVTDQWMDEGRGGEDEGGEGKTEATTRFMKASQAKPKEAAERDGEDADEVERELERQIKEIAGSLVAVEKKVGGAERTFAVHCHPATDCPHSFS